MVSEDERAILELLGERDGEVTTPEAADALDISKPGAWQRLTDLSGRGLVDRHVGDGLSLDTWSLTDEGRARLEP